MVNWAFQKMINNNVVGLVVTYNPSLHEIERVIESISAQVSMLLIVDNGSENAIKLKEIFNKYENVLPFFISRNIGLASAQNYGINHIRESYEDISHVVLFDQDSVIEQRFIDSLYNEERKLVASGNKVGAIGPLFYDPISSEKYPATQYIGPFISRVHLQDEPVSCTYIISSGCMISMETLREVGLMKDELFIDYIDVEWCLRAKNMGFKVYMTPQARMSHTIGEKRISIFGRTISQHSPMRRYYLVRNSLYMIRLGYIPVGYKLREFVFNFSRFFVSLVLSTERAKTVKFSILALRDGFLGRFGAYGSRDGNDE